MFHVSFESPPGLGDWQAKRRNAWRPVVHMGSPVLGWYPVSVGFEGKPHGL